MPNYTGAGLKISGNGSDGAIHPIFGSNHPQHVRTRSGERNSSESTAICVTRRRLCHDWGYISSTERSGFDPLSSNHLMDNGLIFQHDNLRLVQ